MEMIEVASSGRLEVRCILPHIISKLAVTTAASMTGMLLLFPTHPRMDFTFPAKEAELIYEEHSPNLTSVLFLLPRHHLALSSGASRRTVKWLEAQPA